MFPPIRTAAVPVSTAPKKLHLKTIYNLAKEYI